MKKEGLKCFLKVMKIIYHYKGVLKCSLAFMQYFKFVNWQIGELVVSFFDVTNRLYICKQEDLENSEKLDNIASNFSEYCLSA